MKTIFSALFCFLLCATPASAQSPIVAAMGETPVADAGREAPIAAESGKTPIVAVRSKAPVVAVRGRGPGTAGKAKTIDASLGYAYLSGGESFSNPMRLKGVDASFTIRYSRLGIKADMGYARAANVLGTGHHSDLLSYLAGPVFYPTRHRRFDTYIHALVGGARVSGPVRLNGGAILLGGWATGYAWAVGGGLDYWFSDSLAIRSGADYLRTAYYDPSLAVRGQNNIRTTATVVYFFGKRSRTWR
jgi:opacity protein-like surface antigen